MRGPQKGTQYVCVCVLARARVCVCMLARHLPAILRWHEGVYSSTPHTRGMKLPL